MALTVNTNLTAMKATTMLNRSNQGLSRTLGRISSARRINSAADDAAGLGVATNLRTTERSQRAAMRNITTAQSIVSTAEGGLREITHNLQRMRELPTAAPSAASASAGGRTQACVGPEPVLVGRQLLHTADPGARRRMSL